MSKSQLLKTLNPRSLSTLEVYQLTKNLLDDVRENNLPLEDNAQLYSLTETLREKTANLLICLEADKSRQELEQLSQAEKLRKEDYRSLINSTRSYKKASRIADKEAYQLLIKPLEDRKEILTCHHEKATAHISVLLTLFTKEDYRLALKTLNVTHLVDYLIESHQNFEKVSQNYQTSKAKLPKQTPSIAKAEVIDCYQLLIDYVILHHRLNVSPLFTNYLDLINQGRTSFFLSQKHKKGVKTLKINSSDENMPA